jgi:nitroreductase/NAD-dependent dihydropyrimidine dehydrogenase PreA subunit
MDRTTNYFQEGIMSWVSIDYDKCTGCGTCIEGCGRCFTMEDDRVTVYADTNNCVICGRCIAVCPADAITHTEMDMVNFHKIQNRDLISTDVFFEFLRQRRSHRAFTDKKIPEPEMKKLVDIVRYSPTGSNSQMVELLVIQDPDRIKKYSDLSVDFMVKSGAGAKKHAEELRAGGKASQTEINQIEMMAFYGDMMAQSREMGLDPVFYNAPAVMVFHAPDQGFSKKDDCVIASTSMGLLARTMGLEYTYIGIFDGAANGSPEIMKELNLPEGNKVYSVIIVGYPKMKFFSTVDRKPTTVRYE